MLIRHKGGNGELCAFDVADQSVSQQAVVRALEAPQRIDILVNNAGIRHDTLLVFMKPEHWADVMVTNLIGFYNVTQPVVKQMAMNRWGRILCSESAAYLTGAVLNLNGGVYT